MTPLNLQVISGLLFSFCISLCFYKPRYVMSYVILIQVGFSVLPRSGGAPVALDPPLSITHQALHPMESLMKCVERGWMTILVGPTASGKTSLVRLLALLTGHRLRVMAMNSSMDTTELLGGFEQVTTSLQF